MDVNLDSKIAADSKIAGGRSRESKGLVVAEIGMRKLVVVGDMVEVLKRKSGRWTGWIVSGKKT